MKILRRNLSLMLAVRYLNPLRTVFSVITLICTVGVALGVMVLIVVLSVMAGLQKEMDERFLTFVPHVEVSLWDNGENVAISSEQVDRVALQQKLAAIPGVTGVSAQVNGQASIRVANTLQTITFHSIDPTNASQMEPLRNMIVQGEADLGAGLDPLCIISAPAARSLGIGIGDTVTITPLAGGVEDAARIYALIQEPLLLQEDQQLREALNSFFEGAEAEGEGLRVDPAKVTQLSGMLYALTDDKLRPGEQELRDTFLNLTARHPEGAPYTTEDQKAWQEALAAVDALDRDREDGKAAKSINEMVMPTDLEVVAIYQFPENLTGPGLYLPLTIAQDAIGFSGSGEDKVQTFNLRLKDPNNPDEVVANIERALPDLRASTPEHPFGLQWYVAPWSVRLEQWHRLIANERTMLSFVLSIISLIASFCIMAVMFTVSMQRKREIAVLQAIGATPSKIVGIFAWQGVIIGLLGALLGVGLAVLVLHYRLEIQAMLASFNLDPFPMQAHGIELPAVYDYAMFFRQAFKAFVMVIVAATIPALFISRQDPSKALRSN
ncbi:MAG TPA: FtsX-like permease family protein [Candidatus Akkermansia intestinavium]|nr:FtsX-like permease family protein [Candidatus Akkermansia intestinavium]